MLGTWNQTITVYSRYIDKQARSVLWSRKVLHNCFVGKKIIRDLNNHDMIQSEEFVVRIPENEAYREHSDLLGLVPLLNKDLVPICDKSGDVIYLRLDEAERSASGAFTLSLGNVVFLGDVAYDIDEQTDGLRMSDRRNDYKDRCFEIKRFSDNTKIGFLKHYRVEG